VHIAHVLGDLAEGGTVTLRVEELAWLLDRHDELAAQETAANVDLMVDHDPDFVEELELEPIPPGRTTEDTKPL